MKNWTIEIIQSLTERDINRGLKGGEPVDLLRRMNIKGHDVYIVAFGGVFGISALVFKNGRHIYYANDYQLHHASTPEAELPQIYEKKLNRILFTEEELGEPIRSYDEYTRKAYYLHNYWCMQFSRLSIFGNPAEDHSAERAAHPYLCSVCFCYVADEKICDRANELMDQITKAYAAFMENDESFRAAVRQELANHEACLTCDYQPALGALGLQFDELSEARKRIVCEELDRQIHQAM